MLEHAAGSVKSEFYSFCQSKNFVFNPIFDGEFHRFDRDGMKNGWFIAHAFSDEFFVVSFGDWKTGETHTFKPGNVSPDKAEAFAKLEQRAREVEAKRREERNSFAALEALNQWQNSYKSNKTSEYLVLKGIHKLYGARVDKDGVLLIPTWLNGNLTGLQKIWPDGTKRFVSGQLLKGCSFAIGKPSKRSKLFLCEGFATGVTVHEATAMPVVVAFSAQNMVEVAKQFIGYDLTICADNDQWTKGNPGIDAAERCARITNAAIIAPTFTNTESKPTDFNDLYLIQGAAAVKEQLSPMVFSQKRNEKIPLVQQFEMISRAISVEGPQGLPPFPVKLHVVEHVRGEPIIYEETNSKTLHRRSDDFVMQQILNYCIRTTQGKFLFDGRLAKNCATFWKCHAHRLDADILPVAQATQDVFNFHRLPWDFEDGDCPTWDEMFSRMSDPDAVMAYIGSFFEPKSDRQGYCWVHGGGGDGKGALNRFLYKIFNGAYRSETAPIKGDRFWMSGLLNARVVVFPDCNNYNFPTSGMFKAITGDDPVKIELKGEKSFTAPLVCKLLFFSNKRPNISGEYSDVRRAIFSEIAPITGKIIPTKVYDQMLFEEGAYFLHRCVEKYRELCPDHGPIPVNKTEIADLISDNEEELEMLTYRNFDIEPPVSEPVPDNKRWFVAPSRLHLMLDEMKVFGDKRRSYLEFLRRRFGVYVKRVKSEGQVHRRYLGFREAISRETNGIFGAVKRG